ncbi:MAG: DUF5776 domain-containing protein [Lentilactobacillus buchneri]|jgi:hypothetical protein|nr:DUF5776 domain-containing protein [Lentilactobacillus buchneri]
MVKISHILGTAVAAVTLLFTFSLTSRAADTATDAANPVTVYQSKDDGSGWLNEKTYGVLSPRVVQLKHQADSQNNGKLLLTFEQVLTKNQGKTGHPVFPIYESDDNGATWKHITDVSEPQDVHEGWGLMNCPQLYELPQKIGNMPAGTVVLAGDATPNDLSNTDLQLFKSEDVGKSWSYLSSIAKGGQDPTNIMGHDPVWEPFLMVHNNKLICYYSDERNNQIKGSQQIVHETTTDGVTWSDPVVDLYAEKGKTTRPGMPVIAQMSNGKYVMTLEGDLGAIAKVTSDPEKWTSNDFGTSVDSKAGYCDPYVTTLNNGKIAFDDIKHSDIFIFNGMDDFVKTDSINSPAAQYPTQTGASYNRQMMPLADGRLMIVNGGAFEVASAIRVETLNVGDTVQQGKVVIHYVDENGKQIKPDDITTVGTVGTKYDVTDKTKSSITGYQLKGVTQGQNNLAGNFGADPIEITVTYTTSNSGSGSTVTPPASGSSSSSSSSAVTSSSSSSTEASSSSNVTESSSSTTTTTPEASTTKKVTPFKIIAKKALYRYNSTTFSKANRIKGYAKESITKAPVFKVVGTAKSANGALRYQLSDGSYVTAKAGYTVKLYLTKNVKALKVINAKGTWTYKTTKATKKNAVKHLKKGTIVKTKKIVKSGSTTKYQLTNGYYITGSRQYVKAQF